jgi:hypothetical protein
LAETVKDELLEGDHVRYLYPNVGLPERSALVRRTYTNFGQGFQPQPRQQSIDRAVLWEPDRMTHAADSNQLRKSSLTPSQPSLTLRASFG